MVHAALDRRAANGIDGPMTLTIATWNINSVRLRADLVCGFLADYQPDVLCLQEIKCANDHFPYAVFRAAGYEHIEVHGQKAYHGVATLSRLPLKKPERLAFCGKSDARHLAVDVVASGRPVRIHNFYVPAGGDIPDPVANEKFAHKLQFLDELEALGPKAARADTVLVGDLNIAPLETDVWSHKQLLKIVSHTPVETEALGRVQEAGPWVDVVREVIPPEEKVYSWWSYRSRDWSASDRGRRLDHIWATKRMAKRIRDVDVLRPARGWDKPSDHVPVIATFDTARP